MNVLKNKPVFFKPFFRVEISVNKLLKFDFLFTELVSINKLRLLWGFFAGAFFRSGTFLLRAFFYFQLQRIRQYFHFKNQNHEAFGADFFILLNFRNDFLYFG